MKNLRLILAYEGSSYWGWQDAKERPSIEAVLRKPLVQILQHPIKLQAASRTDAGVHAENQVVNFFTAKEPLNLSRLHLSLNQMLPADIRVWSLEEAPLDFHPTLAAQKKTYIYRLTTAAIQLPFDRHFAWHVPAPLNFAAIQEALPLFLGKHHFGALCNASTVPLTNPYCTLYRLDVIHESAENVRIEVEGDRFLYKMVRTLVGTLIALGLGRLSLSAIRALFIHRNRAQAGMTAPAHGLCLKKVHY